MKRFISVLVAIMICVQAFSVVAFAADVTVYYPESGQYTIDDYDLGADKTGSKYSLVVIEAEEEPAKLSLGDGSMIRHIDQAKAVGTKVSFDKFEPRKLQNGGRYFVYIGGDGLDFATKIAELSPNSLAEITWPEVNANEITFGQTLADAFADKLPTNPTPTAKIDEVDYAGKFEVVDATKEPDAGTYDAKLKFVITAEGDYKGNEYVSTKTYPVTVNKAAYPEKITAEDQEIEYTGKVVEYSGVLSYIKEGEKAVKPGTITYSADPKDVDSYTVTIPFTSIDTNYEDPEDVTATLTINKAVAEDIDDVNIAEITAEDAKEILSVEALNTIVDFPETIDIPYGDGLLEPVSVEWTPVSAEWNVKGGVVYEFTPSLESKNLDLSNVDFNGIISVTVVNGTLDTTDFVDKTVPQKTVSDANSLEDLDIPAKANLTIGDKEPKYIDLKWNKTLADVKAAAETVTKENNAEVVFELDLNETFKDYPWLTISLEKTTINMTIKAEEVVLEWPPRDIAKDITYGQTIAEAFPEFPKAGTVKIDGVDYNGEFKLREDLVGEEPSVGTFEAKLVFVAMVDGKERTFDDAPWCYNVTINQAPYEGEIVADNQVSTYTGIAIVYDVANLEYDENALALGEITYNETPLNVGEYTVTIPFTSKDSNYLDPEPVTATLKIEKAVALNPGNITDTLTAEEAYGLDIEDLKARLAPELTIPFVGGAAPEIVPVEWTTTQTVENVKEGVYEFTPVYTCDNLDTSAVAVKAVITVTAVNGELDVENITKNVSKSTAEGFVSVADFDIPEAADLIIDGAVRETVELVWVADKELEDAIGEVTADVNGVITYTLDLAATLAPYEYEWLTISSSATAMVTITDKFAAKIDPFEAPSGVYGTELEDIDVSLIDWTPLEDVKDDAARIEISYIGTQADGTEYASSEKPTQAGSYAAVAILVSATHSATATADFEIAPLDITYTVDDKEKIYGEENPVFTGSSAEVIGEDDLGITFTYDAIATSPVGTYEINAKAANKNYKVTVVPGVLTIIKATLPAAAPTIEGATVVGAELAAELPEALIGIAGIEIQWYANGEAINDATGPWYLVKIADSNKEITAKAVAVEAVNYEGATDASEPVVIDKYEISGTIGITLNTINPEVGTIVTADVTGIKDYELFDLSYQWYIGEEAIENATANTFEIPADKPGVVSVVVTPSADFAGSIKAIVGEIGKVMLPASLVLNSDAEGDIEVGTIITAEVIAEGVTEEDYDLVWLVNGEASSVTGLEYVVTKEDYGKTITAKLVAKGDNYTGEVVSYDVYELYAIAPTNVVINASSTGSSIVVTITADANGAVPYFDASIKEKDAVETLEVATIFVKDGKYEYTFEGLTTGATYTIEVTAWNSEGEGETATKDVTVYYPTIGGGTTTNKKPTNNNQTQGDATDTSVSVESKTETATVPSKDLAGKDTAYATVTTDGGNKVEVAVDIKDKAVDSLTVKAETSEKEVTGKAADGIVGEVIEVKVEAKSGNEAVEVGATITVKADAPAYAYAVDELGNTVRLDSTYDAENGEVVVANVPDGTVLAVSTNAPVDFADVEGRWSEAEVQKAADLGIVNGRGDGYAPEALLTRSETNKLKKNLAEVLKLVLPVNEEVKIDTDPAHWAYESDLWAAQTGITTGTGVNEDGEVVISGEDNVVRQDYITLIARMIKLAIGDAEVAGEAIVFADAADIADYASDAFNLLSSVGILKGSESENGIAANPKANITREEAAALSNRAYDFVKAVKIAK